MNQKMVSKWVLIVSLALVQRGSREYLGPMEVEKRKSK